MKFATAAETIDQAESHGDWVLVPSSSDASPSGVDKSFKRQGHVCADHDIDAMIFEATRLRGGGGTRSSASASKPASNAKPPPPCKAPPAASKPVSPAKSTGSSILPARRQGSPKKIMAPKNQLVVYGQIVKLGPGWCAQLWVQTNNHPSIKPYLKPTLEVLRQDSALQEEIGYMTDGYLIADQWSGNAVVDRNQWAHTALWVELEGATETERNHHLDARCKAVAKMINDQGHLYRYPVTAKVRSTYNRTPSPPCRYCHALLTDVDIMSIMKSYWGEATNDYELPDNFGTNKRQTIKMFVSLQRASPALLYDLKFSAEQVTAIVQRRTEPINLLGDDDDSDDNAE